MLTCVIIAAGLRDVIDDIYVGFRDSDILRLAAFPFDYGGTVPEDFVYVVIMAREFCPPNK